MTEISNKNPLLGLLGTWKGDKGTDLAPKPDEDENNPYYETLTFEAVDIDIENAETQQLVAVRYHQIVTEKANDEVSHDEAGYWIWDSVENTIILAFAIPRGVSVLASGGFEILNSDSNEIVINVSATLDAPNPGIVQSSFMNENAKTTKFIRELRISEDTLSYTQETTVKIYDKTLGHTDKNNLTRS